MLPKEPIETYCRFVMIQVMNADRGQKSRTRKTTAVLAVVLGLAVVVLIACVGYHIYQRPLHDLLNYPVYGGMNDELKDSELFEDMQSGRSICFIGDSITYGFNNEGIPWYEPLVPYIRGEILALSFSGWKTSDLIANGDKIPSADIYVVAIGVNDVIHFDSDSVDPADAEEYREDLEQLSGLVLRISPDAKLYFVAPWPFFYEFERVENRADLYCETLEEWCDESGYIYIDPNPFILPIVEEDGLSKYSDDGLHPNAPDGVGLYSYAVLIAEHDRRMQN